MVAPPLVGVLLAPWAGPWRGLLVVVAGYVVLAAFAGPPRPAGRRAAVAPALGGAGRSRIGSWIGRRIGSRAAGLSAAAAALLAAAVWAPPLAFVDVPAGGHLVSYQEGALAAVSVVEDDQGVARLRINNRQQEGSSASVLADARQALLPLLLHPAPRRALFLGLGTGITAASAARDATLRVDAVELLPGVIAASAHFTARLNDEAPAAPPSARAAAGAGRLRSADPAAARPAVALPHIIAADARRHVRTATARYDVIVSDNFHPARGGSGALYTVEHFRAVRERLTPGGVFCQWLPLHQLDLDTLRSIVQAFVTANPLAWAMLATNSLDTPVIGLVARRAPGGFDASLLRERLRSTALQPLAAYGIADDFAVPGSFIAGTRSLRRFAGTAPANTDDRPVVAYRAPRITYAPDSRPRDRLSALLGELDITPDDLLAPPSADSAEAITTAAAAQDTAWRRRLSAWWRARDQFIRAGRDVHPSSNPAEMLLQVREPLQAVLRTSADFRPAYDPLLHLALAQAVGDPAGARQLLQALQRLQPARPEATQALERLGSGAGRPASAAGSGPARH